MGIFGTPPTALPTITSTALESFGQVQKLIFCRIKEPDGTINKISTTSDAHLAKATYTALKAATDSTKITISPFVQNPTFEPQDYREFGSGNEVTDGIPIPIGEGFTVFTGVFRGVKQDAITVMKGYTAEQGNLGVYLMNGCNQMAGSGDAVSSPTEIYPFPIFGFSINDKFLGGYEGVDGNNIKFSFKPSWSNTFFMWTPSFNPVLEL